MDFGIIRSLYSKPTTARSDHIFGECYCFETEVVKVSRGCNPGHYLTGNTSAKITEWNSTAWKIYMVILDSFEFPSHLNLINLDFLSKWKSNFWWDADIFASSLSFCCGSSTQYCPNFGITSLWFYCFLFMKGITKLNKIITTSY